MKKHQIEERDRDKPELGMNLTTTITITKKKKKIKLCENPTTKIYKTQWISTKLKKNKSDPIEVKQNPERKKKKKNKSSHLTYLNWESILVLPEIAVVVVAVAVAVAVAVVGLEGEENLKEKVLEQCQTKMRDKAIRVNQQPPCLFSRQISSHEPWNNMLESQIFNMFISLSLSLSLSLSVYVSGSCLSVCVFSVIYEYEEKKRKKKEERIVLCMNWILCIYDSNNYYLLFAVHGGFLLHWLELVWMTLWVLMTHMGMAIDFWFLIWILGVLDTKRMGSAQLTELTESICSKKIPKGLGS